MAIMQAIQRSNADGVDVTAALSNVTDDGSICKLAVTKAPAVLTVSSNDDGHRYRPFP